MIAKTLLFLVSLYILLFISLSTFFYISLPIIEWKTKEKFGENFFYVYDQSKGEYGHRSTDPVCFPTFKDIPKDTLFERVVLHHMFLTNWGSAKSFPNRYTYRIPIHFGIIDKNKKFYYWSYWNFGYIYKPDVLISRRFIYMMRDEIEKCRAMTQEATIERNAE